MDTYTKLQKKCSEFQDEFKRECNSNSAYLNKYEMLINRYYIFAVAPEHEGLAQYMYLDSPGAYPTIGYGHLLYTELKGRNAQGLIKKLAGKIPANFPNLIDCPQQLKKYLTITNDELVKLYDDKDICLGLLSIQSMPLMESTGQLVKKTIKFCSENRMNLSEPEKKIRIAKAYNEILTLAVMSKARALKFTRKANLFADYKFYTPQENIPGCNNLIIQVAYAQILAKKDIVKKIKELINPISLKPLRPAFPDFANYPLPAQLALLELAYNGGVGGLIENNPEYYKLVIDQDWEKLAKSKPIISRRDEGIYGKRNKQVGEWFANAAQLTHASAAST